MHSTHRVYAPARNADQRVEETAVEDVANGKSAQSLED